MRNAERVEDKILNAIRKGVLQLEVHHFIKLRTLNIIMLKGI